jgi:hypothetical protein
MGGFWTKNAICGTVFGALLCLGLGLAVFFALRDRDLDSGKAAVEVYCSTLLPASLSHSAAVVLLFLSHVVCFCCMMCAESLASVMIRSFGVAQRTINQFVSLVAAVPDISNNRFKEFYRFAAADFAASAVLSAVWAPYVPAANRSAWEATHANMTEPGPANGTAFNPRPRNPAPFYFPNALNIGSQFIGYDLMVRTDPPPRLLHTNRCSHYFLVCSVLQAQPGRNVSVLRAVESAGLQASPIYIFPAARQPGFLVFIPLYVKDGVPLNYSTPPAPADRWKYIAGTCPALRRLP